MGVACRVHRLKADSINQIGIAAYDLDLHLTIAISLMDCLDHRTAVIVATCFGINPNEDIGPGRTMPAQLYS